jgi:peptidyl-prolyl cis-trans isomerase B (cyclophilin B)
MAERREAAKRRRQRQVVAGSAAALVLVVAGVFWAVTALTDEDPGPVPPAADATPTAEPSVAPTPGECAWTEVPADGTAVDVGTPPPDEPREGTQLMTVATNLGELTVEMDLAASPCIAASFTHLAEQELFDGSKCHRMFPGMLQCGDPTARGEGYRETDGTGGPSYQFADENLPTQQNPTFYPAGTVAMANSGPGTNGSQFFFIYQDTDLNGPNYSVIGTIVGGMEVLEQVDAIGHDGAFDPSPGGGHPNEDVIIETLRMSDPG